MSIRSSKNWKDLVEGPRHSVLTRRDLLVRGLATGAMSVALPRFFGEEFIRTANADTLTCPVAVKNPGAIAQIYSSGGPTMGARFISDAQAAGMNAATATNYGIAGTLQKLGPGMWIDSASVFGMTLLQGPLGFPGGAAGWQSTVLKNICAGGHLGPFNADDGAGLNSGLVGSVSLDRASQLGKDIWFNPAITRAAWTNGTPAAYVSASNIPKSADLLKAFNLNPAAAGKTTAAEMNNAAGGAVAISNALSSIFNTATRKGGSNLITSAGCAFYGNAALTDPTFGPTLFGAANIANLNSTMTVASLSDEEQALAAAFYQSAAGVVGGVTVTYSGRDYHGTSPQTNITPMDVEDARAVVMFLASCYAAQQPGALIYVSNGQAVANGVAAVTATVNGTVFNMNAPVAMGDAGGHYNAGLILFYHPTGQLPTARYSGTLSGTSGDVRPDSSVGGSSNAIAGLYLSAHKFLSGTLPASLVKRLQAMNLAAIPSDLTVI